jgi:hypothetical protein
MCIECVHLTQLAVASAPAGIYWCLKKFKIKLPSKKKQEAK